MGRCEGSDHFSLPCSFFLCFSSTRAKPVFDFSFFRLENYFSHPGEAGVMLGVWEPMEQGALSNWILDKGCQIGKLGEGGGAIRGGSQGSTVEV